MLESALTKKIRRKLDTKYGTSLWVRKIHGNPYQIRGLPDLIGVYRSYFIAMEVKRPGGKPPTDLQALTMKQIRAAGGFATVIHSYEEAVAFLDTVPEPPAEATGGRD